MTAAAAGMTRAEHRARALDLIDAAEEALQARDTQWAAASAALATAHLEAARRYRAPAGTEAGGEPS